MAKKQKTLKIDTAYQEAVKEIQKDKILEIKMIVKATLERINELRKKRAEEDQEMKLLNDDLSDLRRGKIDRIKKRHEEKQVKNSPINPQKLEDLQRSLTAGFTPSLYTFPSTTTNAIWTNAAQGPFTLSDNSTVTLKKLTVGRNG